MIHTERMTADNTREPLLELIKVPSAFSGKIASKGSETSAGNILMSAGRNMTPNEKVISPAAD